MDARMQLVTEYLKGELTMSEVCLNFSISRKTGYKWVERYKRFGPSGLEDRSRAPLNHPNAIDESIVKLLVESRLKHPTWGPKKLLAWIQRDFSGLDFPAASSVGELLKKYDLLMLRASR